jgi:hypothetical protein
MTFTTVRRREEHLLLANIFASIARCVTGEYQILTLPDLFSNHQFTSIIHTTLFMPIRRAGTARREVANCR